MAHIGVKNRTAEKQYLKHDGQEWEFAPAGQKGSIRLVEGVPEGFILNRMIVQHVKKPVVVNGEETERLTPQVQGQRLFDVMPLDEAVKAGAIIDEDPRVVEARKQAEAKAAERKQLLEELKNSLQAEGWVPPAKKGSDASQVKGGPSRLSL